MSERNWKRLDVIRHLEKGDLRVTDAARVLGISERWLLELRRAVEQGGAQALGHGNRGRAPANRLAEEVREAILALARTKYAGFNDQHLTEKLVDVENFSVSRSTVRRLLRDARIGMGRGRRASKHRRRRDRKLQAGLMILWDGSRHDWLEGRGPRMCLMGAIDDATGEMLPGAHFVDQECAASYLRTLHAIVQHKGIPHSAYMDRHGALKRNDDHWTLEEELRGQQDLTHVGRSLQSLEIECIYALSPQAKGRVERMWKTHQDRLVSELRLQKVETLEHANRVLAGYVPEHNRRFALAPQDATPAWRAVRRGTDIDRICSFKYDATVGNDNTVRIAGQVIDIPPGPGGRSYAKARAEVNQLLDGSWHLYVKDCLLATKAASAVVEVKPLKKKKRSAASRAFRVGVAAMRVSAILPAQPTHHRASRSRVPLPFNDPGPSKSSRAV